MPPFAGLEERRGGRRAFGDCRGDGSAAVDEKRHNVVVPGFGRLPERRGAAMEPAVYFGPAINQLLGHDALTVAASKVERPAGNCGVHGLPALGPLQQRIDDLGLAAAQAPNYGQ